MKKIIVNDCAQYFTALKEIKKGIKAQILDYDEDEEIDGGFAAEEITKLSDGVPVELWTANMIDYDYNDSAQKTPAVRKNVRGMNAPITNNATIIPTGFSSGIVGFSWPDVLQNAVIRCIALLFQEKHFR